MALDKSLYYFSKYNNFDDYWFLEEDVFIPSVKTIPYLDKKYENITQNINFSELCITSKAEVFFEKNSEIKAITTKADGSKCSLCWKINEGGCDRPNCPKSS